MGYNMLFQSRRWCNITQIPSYTDCFKQMDFAENNKILMLASLATDSRKSKQNSFSDVIQPGINKDGYQWKCGSQKHKLFLFHVMSKWKKKSQEDWWKKLLSCNFAYTARKHTFLLMALKEGVSINSSGGSMVSKLLCFQQWCLTE